MKKSLQIHVQELSHVIGERNFKNYQNLTTAAKYIEKEFENTGNACKRQEFIYQEKSFFNLEAEIKGQIYPNDIFIIGAHYDTVVGSPGANDNGSGVAALIEILKCFTGQSLKHTFRFVAFANEEPPFIRTKNMGSYHYAREKKSLNEKIKGAFILDTIGYYSDEKRSQKYFSYFLPQFYYPNQGNFIAMVSNISSKSLLDSFKLNFIQNSSFPLRTFSAPYFIRGFNSSDQWSFWKHNYPSMMITDTAPLRYPYYHTVNDTYEKVDYDKLERLVQDLDVSFKNFDQNYTH